ncbi:MAG TPA: hypothetical protein VNL70_06905, partial [Tepidisphaeraceae bacterium]|nr:hypothetical protein [Tepidisphaeraceae bacterium]
MSSRRPTAGGLEGVLSDPRVLRANRGEELGIWYSAPGIVQVLTETEHADKYWADLKTREPALARLAERVEFQVDEDGRTIAVDALDLEGVLRLIQSIPSPRAERIKRWMAESARQRLEEAE